MPDITVTIPANKVSLVKSAILHHSGEESMTNQEAIDWLKIRWISDLKSLTKKKEEADHNTNLVLTDPTT